MKKNEIINLRKNIDIDNEEQILKECNFDYFYNCEECSSELCRFYNDIFHNSINHHFDSKEALIDLGRIAITLNEQSEKIKELEEEIENHIKIIYDKNNDAILCGDCYCINNDVRKLVEENKCLEQSQNQKAIEVLEKVKKRNRLFLSKIVEDFIDAEIIILRGDENV